MPKIEEFKNKEVAEDIGYECDICGKHVIFRPRFLPQFNVITWSFPAGNGGERTATEDIYICSLECMIKALKKIYFGAHIELSYDFLESIKEKND